MEKIQPKKQKFSLTTFGLIIAFIIFILYSVTLIFPFLWIFVNSFRDIGEWQTLVRFNDYISLPQSIDFSNYETIINYNYQGTTIGKMFITSVVVTVLGTIVNVFFSACAAYVISKYEFKGKKLIYAFAIFTMVVPIVGTLPAQIEFMEFLNLNDSLVGLLYLYSGAFGFNFILFYSAFESISWSYAEAAQMDGANHFQIFFKVMLPLCKGPIISCSILEIIALWNDYSTPFLFMNSNPTLAVGLQDIQTELQNHGEYPLLFAAIIISIIPVVIIYSLFQKKIIENTVAGGLKG